ncbi:MAG: hypothetical protein JNK05_04555 [Myxococcales bacterium]|nr:hypothetical protein [Myxococcales bacterium]
MKQARQDERRVTLRYKFDRATGRTSLTVDVEVPEDEMPHEHRQDLKEMAEEILGVPLGALGENVEVQLKRAGKAHDHDHDHDHDHEHEPAREENAPTRQGVKT